MKNQKKNKKHPLILFLYFYFFIQEKLTASTSVEERAILEGEIKQREVDLEPMYHQVAVHFADLHDTPERMLEKGVISEIIPWKKARRMLYWRLRRKLLESDVIEDILSAQPSFVVGTVVSMLRRWFVEDRGPTDSYLWDQDEAVSNWMISQIEDETSVLSRNINCVKKNAVLTRVKEALECCPEVRLDAVIELAHRLQASERSELLRTLSQLEGQDKSGSS